MSAVWKTLFTQNIFTTDLSKKEHANDKETSRRKQSRGRNISFTSL